MIWQCFRNALHWYQVLIAMTDQEVDTWIQNMTSAVTVSPDNTNSTENTNKEIPIQGRLTKLQKHLVEGVDDEDDICQPLVFQSTTAMATMMPDCSSDTEINGSTSGPLRGTATPFFQSDMPNALPLPFPLPKDFLWMEENVLSTGLPSIYLQRWCLMCFSRKPYLQTSVCVLKLKVYTSMPTDISISAQAIVCVDANFAQQRCHSHHPNPVDPHPDTHFLSVDDVESMKCAVEHARSSTSKANTKLWATLPDDTLDDCEKVFTAAQGHIAKTSNTIFADTALMALLCRHD